MEDFNTCKICDTELQQHGSLIDYFGEKESFHIKACPNCQTLYTLPRPKENEIVTYYKSNSYVSHGSKTNPFFDFIYKQVQYQNAKNKLKLLSKYTVVKNHLDYGAGTGHFVKFLQSKQWTAVGIEPDSEARAVCLNKHSIPLLSGLDRLKSNARFTSISMFHVLEHVHQLEETFSQIIQLLDRNGIILLALPNYKSYDAQYFQDHWAGYDVPRHLCHFTQKSIFTLSKKFGLNIVATHPMTFDSYYVSLLSTQYQTGRKQPIKAFSIGYKSNRKASRNKEYSSLIYVLSR